MKKLLIVDDELDICEFMKGFFTVRDFDVSVAHNGVEALAKIDSFHPDVILLDVMMPIKDGFETLKEAKEKNKSLKVIMVTAIDDEAKIKEMLKFNSVYYIHKPLSLEELEHTVLQCVK
ncbi:MAG: response regulator [Candidatus Omnitrophica bacterium]|nr:response regulator [Candidatus Omnitrophota bacterium]